MIMPDISVTFTPMGRKPQEITRNKSIRLPDRLWNLLESLSDAKGQSVNNTLWRLVESYLVRNKRLRPKDRKRPPLN